MSQSTSISWTDVTWNPTFGCSIVSTECRNCYAQALALRFGHSAGPWTPANAAENVILKPHKLREPFSAAKHWRGLGAAAAAAGKTDGQLVFVNSMSDLFHEQIPNEFIAAVFAVMAAAERHTFQVLTKRPERMLAWFDWYREQAYQMECLDEPGEVALRAARQYGVDEPYTCGAPTEFWPLPNVWLGISIGLRHFAGRADLLRRTPAAVRFISAEPLLGPRAIDGIVWSQFPELAGIARARELVRR